MAILRDIEVTLLIPPLDSASADTLAVVAVPSDIFSAKLETSVDIICIRYVCTGIRLLLRTKYAPENQSFQCPTAENNARAANMGIDTGITICRKISNSLPPSMRIASLRLMGICWNDDFMTMHVHAENMPGTMKTENVLVSFRPRSTRYRGINPPLNSIVIRM